MLCNYGDFCVIRWWFLMSSQKYIAVLGTNLDPNYVPISVPTLSYLHIDIFTYIYIKKNIFLYFLYFIILFLLSYSKGYPYTVPQTSPGWGRYI